MAGMILCMLEMREAFSPRVNRSPTPSTEGRPVLDDPKTVSSRMRRYPVDPEIIPYLAKLDGVPVHQGKTVAGLKGTDKNDPLLPRLLDLQHMHRKQARDQGKRRKEKQKDIALFIETGRRKACARFSPCRQSILFDEANFLVIFGRTRVKAEWPSRSGRS